MATPADAPVYTAFISYQRRSSRRYADRLQVELERIARRTTPDSVFRIFRDETDMPVTILDDAIKDALRRSEYMVVLLHRDTKESPWVSREISYWLESGGSPARLIPVRIDPGLDMTWDAEKRAFAAVDSFPSALIAAFDNEPHWIDLRFTRLGQLVDTGSQVARLCATLLDRDPTTVLQRELRDAKMRQRRLRIVVTTLIALLIIAIVASVIATDQTHVARAREREAIAQANATEALLVSKDEPQKAASLLIRAAENSQDQFVRAAILSILSEHPQLLKVLARPTLMPGSPDDVVFSESGERLLGWQVTADTTALAIWNVDDGRVIQETKVAGRASQVSFIGGDRVAYCSGDGVHIVKGTPTGVLVQAAAIAGEGGCYIRTSLRGGVALADGTDGPGTAIISSPVLDRTVEDVTGATTLSGSEYVLIRSDARWRAHSTSSGTVQELPALGSADLPPFLDTDMMGSVLARIGDRVAKISVVDPAARVAYIPTPRDVADVKRIPSVAGAYIWITRSGEVGWSRTSQTLDLSTYMSGLKTAPELWVSREGRQAVVGTGAHVVTIDLTVPPVAPKMKIAGDAQMDLIFSQRDTFMTPPERGGFGTFVPSGKREVRLLPSSLDSYKGVGFFNDIGSTAVVFGDEGATAFTGTDQVKLADQGDIRAAAISPGGSHVALVRPNAPVTLYGTTPTEQLDSSLISSERGPWSLSWTGGVEAYVETDDGSVALRSSTGSKDLLQDLQGKVSGIYAVAPDGSAAAVGTTDGFAGEQHVIVVDADDKKVDLAASCDEPGGFYQWLPGADFRSSTTAAATPELALVRPAGGAEIAAPLACYGAQRGSLATAASIFAYRMTDDDGMIVARSDDRAIQVVSWSDDGQTSIPNVEPLAGGSDPTNAYLNSSRDVVTTVDADDGTVSWFQDAGNEWTIRGSIRTALQDVVWATADLSASLIIVVDNAGTLEITDLGTGRRLLTNRLEVRATAYEAGSVASVDAQESGGSYGLNLGVGPGSGQITDNYRVSFSWSTDRLLRRLCVIYPSGSDACGG